MPGKTGIDGGLCIYQIWNTRLLLFKAYKTLSSEPNMLFEKQPTRESLKHSSNLYPYSAAMKNISSVGTPRIIGYSLLLMVLINWGDIFIPSQFMDPTWELEMVGAIVESVPLFFFSLLFIFYGEAFQRNKRGKVFVLLLSYACLLLGICLFILVPLATNSTIRINQQVDVQMGDIFRQQMTEIEAIETQLSQASNQEIVEILNEQGIEIESEQSVLPKEQLIEYLKQAKADIQQQTDSSRRVRKQNTMKSAFKWILGATISGFTLIYLWLLTRWARVDSKFENSGPTVTDKAVSK